MVGIAAWVGLLGGIVVHFVQGACFKLGGRGMLVNYDVRKDRIKVVVLIVH